MFFFSAAFRTPFTVSRQIRSDVQRHPMCCSLGRFPSLPTVCSAKLAHPWIAHRCTWTAIVRASMILIQRTFQPAHQKHWLWGHEYALWLQETNVKQSQHSRWAALLGPVYRIKAPLFNPDVVSIDTRCRHCRSNFLQLVVSDNVSTQHIFQHCYRYVKAPEFRPNAEKWFGKGIVWAEGEEHQQQRKVLAPAFTYDFFKAIRICH